MNRRRINRNRTNENKKKEQKKYSPVNIGFAFFPALEEKKIE